MLMARSGGSYFKRHTAHSSFRAADNAEKAAAGCFGSTVKLFLYAIVSVFILGIIGIFIPYVLIAVAAVALIFLTVRLVRRKKTVKRAVPIGSDLCRDAEIVRDCQELINKSENLETVAQRYQSLVFLLSEMQKRPQADFEYYGVNFGVPISSVLASLESNKSVIFCQAIDRAFKKCKRHADGLKTEKGKKNALYKFHCDTRSVILRHNLPAACSEHLDEIISLSL